MIEIGRVCLKISGRDGGKRGVIVDIIDDNYVIIDGEVRRKRCNIKHLEPSKSKIEIEKNAPHETVVREFEKLGIKIREKKGPKKKSAPPISQKKK